MEVKVKGFEHPVTLYEVIGIGTPYKLYLPETIETLVRLTAEVPFTYEIVETSCFGRESYKGTLTRLSASGRKYVWKNQFPF
jgi:hypothetical protein